MCSTHAFPQAGYERMTVTQPVSKLGTDIADEERGLFTRLDGSNVLMMGDNPALPVMPQRPRLIDFFQHRFEDMTFRHLTSSAKHALDAGLDENVVLACLLHDISNACLICTDHGYWGAQMIAPYVEEEVSWAVKYHQPLRFFADESVGYAYPESYVRAFGSDYVPPDYIRRDADHARNHRWYMSARQVTLNDVYFGEDEQAVDLEVFTDVIGRNFKEPTEGLGFDGSPVAHMWRTIIWPHNAL